MKLNINMREFVETMIFCIFPAIFHLFSPEKIRSPAS